MMRMERAAGRCRPTRAGLAAMIGLALIAAGCGDAGPATEPRLAGGTASLEQLGREVWEALVAQDTAALERLRLSEYEHNELVWPEQPAAAEPSAAANLGQWWGNVDRRSTAALHDLLRRYGGDNRPLGGVDCAGEPREYETYRALTGCRLHIGGPVDGEPVEAFRYVVVMDGRYKVVRYYD